VNMSRNVFSANTLRDGCIIEVLWNLQQQGTERSVWWPAQVDEISSGDASDVFEATAVLRYAPHSRVDPSALSVWFLPGKHLTERDPLQSSATKYKWRLTTDLSANVNQTRSPSHLQQAAGGDCNGDAEVSSQLLPRRVTLLEQAVAAYENALLQSQHFLVTQSRESYAMRTLRFTSQKLGEQLQRSAVPLRTKRLYREKQANFVTSGVLRVQVDCTLCSILKGMICTIR
jgi:hypothetical protein